ncbi:CTP synthase [Ureaplasma canigenitalium]|uniref:CTP synthase n=1 Tax=Ureaplasma canigenitalium TaxID=42092 RepID=UPI0004E1E442|nr:CTP synthase [Ureaplasma canigenitalium]
MQKNEYTKFIFVTGGVYSSLGKGVCAASIGRILVEYGYKVMIQKLDPYLNIDPTNLSLSEHGEIFVTSDGKEADLDLGTYERFIDTDLKKYSSITMGKIYHQILQAERRNDFHGKTVQIVPHVTNKIIDFIKCNTDTKPNFVIVEIGGTVGDIESAPIFEAIYQFKNTYGYNNVMNIHVSPLIDLQNIGELKTKPTQHSIKTLRSLGLSCNLLVLRLPYKIDQQTKDKLAISCGIVQDNVFCAYDAESTYFVPNILYEQKIQYAIFDYFRICPLTNHFDQWIKFTSLIKKEKKQQIRIGIVGLYTSLPDAYKSVYESLFLACIENDANLHAEYISLADESKVDVDELIRFDALIFPSQTTIKEGINHFQKVVDVIKQHKIRTLYLGHSSLIRLAIDKKTDFMKVDSIYNLPFINKSTDHYYVGAYKIQNIDSISRSIYQYETVSERFKTREMLVPDYLKNDQHFKVVSVLKENNAPVLIVNNDSHWFETLALFEPQYSSKPLKVNPLFINLIKQILEGRKDVK